MTPTRARVAPAASRARRTITEPIHPSSRVFIIIRRRRGRRRLVRDAHHRGRRGRRARKKNPHRHVPFVKSTRRACSSMACVDRWRRRASVSRRRALDAIDRRTPSTPSIDGRHRSTHPSIDAIHRSIAIARGVAAAVDWRCTRSGARATAPGRRRGDGASVVDARDGARTRRCTRRCTRGERAPDVGARRRRRRRRVVFVHV